MSFNNNRGDGEDVRFQSKHILYYLFLFLCMFPFLFGNPVFETDMQPYALVLAMVICFLNIAKPMNYGRFQIYFIISLSTIFIAVLLLLFSGVSMKSIRGFYNYCAIFFIPWAVYITICTIGGFPERFIKLCITIWFVVCLFQFFVDRSFAVSLVGTVRWKDMSRGVVGLASEPSYLGITCFYFLLMTSYFGKRKWLYITMILIMGVLFAQSSLGIIFIVAYWSFFLIDNISSKKGSLIVIVTIFMVFGFLFLLNTVLIDTRVNTIITGFMNEGTMGVEDDSSVNARYNSIFDAIQDAFGNYLMPIGFRGRVGSAYGGFLCELGLFAIPLLYSISKLVSFSFSKMLTRILFFIAFTILMFNNTQLGNPLLLFVVATNAIYCSKQLLTINDTGNSLSA